MKNTKANGKTVPVKSEPVKTEPAKSEPVKEAVPEKKNEIVLSRKTKETDITLGLRI